MEQAPRPSWSVEARRFLAFLRLLLLVALVATAGVAAWLILPPTPAPLPAGATRLELRTLPSGFGARLVLGCQTAGFPDVRVAREGGSMVFVRVDGRGFVGGGLADLVWPAGWSARLVAGRAELVTPDGDVVAREGDVIRGLGGGDSIVCLSIGTRPVVEPGR